MFRIVSPVLRVYDDGAVESLSQHVLKAIYLKIILSLLTKLDMQSNWCGAGAQRIAGCKHSCQRQWQSSHGALKAGRLELAVPARFYRPSE